MKKILIVLCFSALLSSCGNNYSSGDHEISIRFKSGAQQEYKLLFVRDSSLVVIAADEEETQYYYSHAVAIRFDSIYKVYRSGTAGASQHFLAGAIGFGVGALAGTLFASSPQPGSTSVKRELTSGAIGMASGMTISFFIPPNDKQLHPIYKKDREFLRSISRFSGGEPEMLKLVR